MPSELFTIGAGLVLGVILGVCIVIGVVALAYTRKYKRLISTMESLNDEGTVEITVKRK
jgi:nitrate reductase gamma subunit